MEQYGVYIQVDEKGRVTAINSDAFMSSTDGWTKIDEGVGDRYHHAQGNYLPGPLMDERGIYRYKVAGGQVVERTQEEMEADWTEPEPAPTLEERVAEVQAALAALMGGIEDGRNG